MDNLNIGLNGGGGGDAVVNSYNATASSPAKAFTGTWFTGGTATTTKPQVLIEPTGTTSTAWSTSGTGFGVNAASGFAGNLLDLQVNGTSQFRIASNGGAIFPAPSSTFITLRGVDTNSLGINLTSAGEYYRFATSTGFFVQSGCAIGWSNGYTDTGTYDVRLFRDAANTLAQRNGTNAQAFRIYNTYTSSTNYELGKLEWYGSEFRIGTEAASPGIVRSVGLYSGSTRYQIIGSNYNQFDKDVYLNAANIVTGGAGFKIGTATTQKIGFYNATPVVQPAAVADATDAATAITQLNALLARMRDLGLIAT
jgi:hypothetical protein